MPQSTLLNLPSSDDLSLQFTEDIQLGCLEFGLDVPPVGKGTHFGLTATGAGNIGSVLIANQQLIDQDINPLTATGAALEDIRISDGLAEKPPVAARLLLTATVQGVATIPAGLAWQGPGGVRGTVDTLVTGNSQDVTVYTTVTDAGSAGNLDVGAYVNFINAPLNVQTQAIVTAVLSEGADVESDEDKRDRIMLARQNPPAGGNWSQLVEVALATETNADGVAVYPALGGPGGTKVILWRTNATTPQSRHVDQAGIDAVINAFDLAFPREAQSIVVDTCINNLVHVWYEAELAQSGGAYWVDGLSAWPEYPYALASLGGASYSLTSEGIGNATALTASETRTIAAWDSVNSTFIQATITAVSGTSPGPYTVTVSGTAANLNGMIACPWAPNINGYASEVLAAMALMGPGEYLASTHARFPRSHRRPEPNVSDPYVLNAVQSAAVQAAFPSEILQLLFALTSASPTLPANAAGKPRILVPLSIAFYPGI
jgi:hypothetical protein